MPAAGRKIVINALDNHNTLRLRSNRLALGYRGYRGMSMHSRSPASTPRVNPVLSKVLLRYNRLTLRR